MGHRPPATDDTDRAMIEKYRAEWDALPGPRIGDFVQMLDGTTRRFTKAWDHGIQTTCPPDHPCHRDQSFYFDGRADFSGSLSQAVPVLRLEQTSEMRDGNFWTFHHGEVRAHNGVSFAIPCRVFRELAHPRTVPEGEPELHAVDPDNGQRLRHATPAEAAAWSAQPARHPSFRKAIRVGTVLVDEYTGPGGNHVNTPGQPFD